MILVAVIWATWEYHNAGGWPASCQATSAVGTVGVACVIDGGDGCGAAGPGLPTVVSRRLGEDVL